MNLGYFVVSESTETNMLLSKGLGSHICTPVFIAALFTKPRVLALGNSSVYLWENGCAKWVMYVQWNFVQP